MGFKNLVGKAGVGESATNLIRAPVQVANGTEAQMWHNHPQQMGIPVTVVTSSRVETYTVDQPNTADLEDGNQPNTADLENGEFIKEFSVDYDEDIWSHIIYVAA